MNRKSLSVAPPDKPNTGSKRKAAAEATGESEGCRHEKKRVRALKGKDVIASTDPVKRANQDEPAEAGSSKKQNAAAAAVQLGASKAARSSHQVRAQKLRPSNGLNESLTAILHDS